MFGEINDGTLIKVMSNAYCILETRKLTNTSTYTWNTTYCDNDYSCTTQNNTVCMFNVYIVKILLAAYMMFSAVLMLNLMVAGINFNFPKVAQ